MSIHRTLIKIIATDKDGAWIVAPAYDSDLAVRRAPNIFPKGALIQAGEYFYAKIDYNADPQHLEFVDIEFED